MKVHGPSATCVVLLLSACARESAAPPADPAAVSLTWLSVTSWLLEAGETRVLFDGYVSRVDRTTVEADGTSTATAPLDTAAVRRVRDAVPGAAELDWVLVGHGHWDHAFDTPAWAKLTGARIAGARSVCLVAEAHGIETGQCRAVEGGETLELGPGVTAYAVRWHHSGDSLSVDGRRLRAPLELRDRPTLDPATGGLRPGYLEDYPNGAGSRAWLIRIETGDRPVTLFWSNTGNPQAWDAPIPADSAFFRAQGIPTDHLVWAAPDRATRQHLDAALAGAGLDGVDLWLGFGGHDHVAQVISLLRPATFVPHHWDDFWIPLEDGPGRAFRSDDLEPLLQEAGIRLLVPAAYFDRILLSTDSAWIEDGARIRSAPGLGAPAH